MKKLILGFICIIVIIGGSSIVLYSIEENIFPNQYKEVLESFFG